MSVALLTKPNSVSQLGYRPVIAASGTANTVLTALQSGSIVAVPSCTANVQIQLPAVQAGLSYRIVFQAVADGTHTAVVQVGSGPTANALQGLVLNAAPAALTSTLFPTQSITRTATAANTKPGDFVDVYCDGTTYWAHAIGGGTAATFTVA